MTHSQAFLKVVNDAKTRIKETTPDKVKARLDSGDRFFFVDVREDSASGNGDGPKETVVRARVEVVDLMGGVRLTPKDI
jgi:hypothetical protein